MGWGNSSAPSRNANSAAGNYVRLSATPLKRMGLSRSPEMLGGIRAPGPPAVGAIKKFR